MQYSDDIVWKVWGKAIVVSANDAVFWRMDPFGAWILRSQYGIKSDYGWVIDLITPLSEGGTNDLSNLCPMHWQNIKRKVDGSFECHVIAQGARNFELIENH